MHSPVKFLRVYKIEINNWAYIKLFTFQSYKSVLNAIWSLFSDCSPTLEEKGAKKNIGEGFLIEKLILEDKSTENQKAVGKINFPKE